jgi:hypothetical protein
MEKASTSMPKKQSDLLGIKPKIILSSQAAPISPDFQALEEPSSN